VAVVSSDDDWFERAFADEESDDGEESEAGDGREQPPDETPTEPTEGSDETPTEPDATDRQDGAADATAAGGTTAEGTDSPFAEDFSAAFRNAPEPDAGVAPEPTDADDGAPGTVFGDDAADLFAGASGGFSTTEFDEESFESDLDRIDIGIDGLDDMILGGVPIRSLVVAIGSAGTGKTTMGMQFLDAALSAGDRAVYISLEESRERVIDTAEEKGWEFGRHEEAGRLAVVDLDPVEMANSLASIRNDLTRLIEDFGAERLVLDSVSLLEMMYDHPSRRRSEVFQFTRALKQAGVTTLVTSEASESDPFASRYGIIEYLADAVFILQYVRSNDFQETRTAIEIQKIRDANHSRQPKPYEITDEGISVHQQANLF
jgi:KaiC domain protein